MEIFNRMEQVVLHELERWTIEWERRKEQVRRAEKRRDRACRMKNRLDVMLQALEGIQKSYADHGGNP